MDANYKRIPFVQRLARFAFLTPILNGLWLAVPFLCLVDSDAFWVYLVAAFLIFSPKISSMVLSYLCPALMCVTVFFVHNQGANLSTFYYCFFVLWLVLFPNFILVGRRMLSGRYYYSMMDNQVYDLGKDNMILASRYKRQD